jgi:hypothetical protein
MNFAVVHNRVQTAKKSKDHSNQEKRKARAEAGQFDLNELSHLEIDLKLKPVDPLQAWDAVEANVNAPVIQGMLKKRAGTLFGVGPTVWHNRYFELDPLEGVLSYWEPGLTEKVHFGEPGVIHFERQERPASTYNHLPKHTFMLRNIIQVESNRRHRIFHIMICKTGNHGKYDEKTREVGKVLQLQAASESEFNHWIQALEPYGMRQGPKTPTRKSKKSKK